LEAALDNQEVKINTKEKRRKKKSVFREYAEAAIIAVLLALFIRAFVVQAFKIPSASMEPTLMIGDHILVNKFIYGIKIPYLRKTLIPVTKPERGDVIVFIYPNDKSKDYIKRIIGLPGDKIEVKGQKVYINDEVYKDEHAHFSITENLQSFSQREQRFSRCIVPEGNLFVMGDNRDHSSDSRYWGFVPEASVKGKAFIIYWSWPHWARFFHLIH
jgi:signal peptidase I